MLSRVPSTSGLMSRRLLSASTMPFRKKKLLKQYREVIANQRAMNEAHEVKAKEAGLGFRTVVAAILHRYPVITPQLEDWELEMETVKEKIEDKKREHFFNEVRGTDAQLVEEQNPSYQEILDSMPFEPAPRRTQADIDDDKHSMERGLDKSSFLIVKRNRDDKSWQFPQGRFMEEKDDSARAAAERVIDRAVGRINRWFVSNAPVGHICYAYPKELQEKRGQYGAKVFFYRTQIIKGNIKLETRLYTDYAWISRDEVDAYFEDEGTRQAIKAMLPF